MINSKYSPQRWVDIEVSKVSPNVVGISEVVTQTTTENKDLLITDDFFIREIQVLTQNAAYGDTLTIKIIDIDNILGCGVNFVVSTPVSNFNVAPEHPKQEYSSVAPFKILAGLYIRVSYTSVGTSSDVSLGLNFIFLKALI